MSVLNRKLFNRGGKVSSRGVGITSGLVDQPVQKFSNGGLAEKYKENLEMLKGLNLFPETKRFDTKAALLPYIMDVSGRLLAGTSPTGDLGEIAGKALQGGNPCDSAHVFGRGVTAIDSSSSYQLMSARDINGRHPTRCINHSTPPHAAATCACLWLGWCVCLSACLGLIVL